MASRPDPVDVHVGRRLRERRTLVGMSQERLGELLGVTFQQIQKYERGANRIGSSRLYQIAQALAVPPSWFFEELPEPGAPDAEPVEAPTPGPGLAEPPAAGFDFGPAKRLRSDAADAARDREAFRHRDVLELVRAYRRISDPLIRRRLFELAKALAVLSDHPPADPPP